jgi:hypothetical protein
MSVNIYPSCKGLYIRAYRYSHKSYWWLITLYRLWEKSLLALVVSLRNTGSNRPYFLGLAAEMEVQSNITQMTGKCLELK